MEYKIFLQQYVVDYEENAVRDKIMEKNEKTLNWKFTALLDL